MRGRRKDENDRSRLIDEQVGQGNRRDVAAQHGRGATGLLETRVRV
jgi:hypothetical protein